MSVLYFPIFSYIFLYFPIFSGMTPTCNKQLHTNHLSCMASCSDVFLNIRIYHIADHFWHRILRPILLLFGWIVFCESIFLWLLFKTINCYFQWRSPEAQISLTVSKLFHSIVQRLPCIRPVLSRMQWSKCLNQYSSGCLGQMDCH